MGVWKFFILLIKMADVIEDDKECYRTDFCYYEVYAFSFKLEIVGDEEGS